MSQLVRADGILIDHILDTTHELWHDGLPRSAYGRFWQAQLATDWGRQNLTRWALVDGTRLLSSAKVYRFNARLDGRAVRIAGLGAVFTSTAERGRGAARELITLLLAQEARDGCDAALLFSEIGSGYYERLGFTVVPIHDLTLRVVEDVRRGAPATMVRAGDERDIAEVVGMDAARAESFRFHLARDRDLVKFALTKKRLLAGLSAPGRRELQFFVAEEGASAVAYVAIAVKDDRWTIDSCGDRDRSGARIGAILQVLIAREPAVRRPRIAAWLPDTLRPPQLEIAAAAASRDVMMIKPLRDSLAGMDPLQSEDVLYWRGDAF